MPSRSAKGLRKWKTERGDLLSGAKNSYIATLVERHSRFAMLIKVSSKDTEVVIAALSQHVRKLPATLRRSLTWDRGLEMSGTIGPRILVTKEITKKVKKTKLTV